MPRAHSDTDAVFAQFAANLARGSVAECVLALRLLSVVCVTLGEEHALHTWLRPLRTIIQRRQVRVREYMYIYMLCLVSFTWHCMW